MTDVRLTRFSTNTIIKTTKEKRDLFIIKIISDRKNHFDERRN